MSKDEKKAEENQANRQTVILGAYIDAVQKQTLPAEEGKSTSERLLSKLGSNAGPLTPIQQSNPRDADIQRSQSADMTSYQTNLKSGVEKNTRSPTATPDLVKGYPDTAPLAFGVRPATVPSKAVGDAKVSDARGQSQTRTIDKDKAQRR